jgi:hypothetical protein
MALQGSGQISIKQVATEFGDTAPHGMKEFYNGGGKVPANNTNVPTSGAIGLKNFYNAVNRVALTVTFGANTTQTSVSTATVPGYIAGISDVTVYVSSGVYVYSTTTSSPALTLGQGFAAGDTIALVNNGYIMGMGGAGTKSTGGAAGPAMSLSYNITLTNNSYIAGGGGGGGSGGTFGASGGGGAGGGAGINANANTIIAGGVVGSVGNTGDITANVIGGPSPGGNFGGSGASGGRILPGTGGTGGPGGFGGTNNFGGAGGAGGGGGGFLVYGFLGEGTGNGGAGGAANNTGSNASGTAGAGGGGGGWGAAGGTSGGAGGKAIALNGFTVTYVTTGTVYGAVS